jgi:hypothetical protein
MSIRKVGWAVAVVVVVAAGGQFWRMQTEMRHDRDAIARLEASVEHLEERPATVRIEHETRVERVVGAEDRPPTADTDPANTATAGAGTAPAQPSLSDQLASRYADEPIDQVWSVEALNGLKEAVASLGLDRNVESVDCRSALCRIQAQFPNRDAYSRFMDQLPGHLAGGDTMISPTYDELPNGAIRATSYWIRKGQLGTVTNGLANGPSGPPQAR